MVTLKVLVTSAVLILLPLAALSDGAFVQGEEAPEFKLAVRAWLDGDDLAGLKAMSELAKNGNTAAQILLASIAGRSSFHSHLTTKMDRSARISLLRMPGGFSGKSWLSVAQETEPIALALLQVAKAREKTPAIAALVEFGEPQTAMIAAQKVLKDGQGKELIAVLQGLDHKLPPEADILLFWALFQAEHGMEPPFYGGSPWLAWRLTGEDRFLRSELVWRVLETRKLVENPEFREAATKFSGEIEAWTPIRQLCSKYCPNEIAMCTAMGGSLLASPFTPRSPLQSLISNDEYWASDRIEGDVARSIVRLEVWDSSKQPTPSPCFLSTIKELQLKHWP